MQVSSVTERGRVYDWLDQTDDKSVPTSAAVCTSSAADTEQLSGLLSTSKLNRTVAHLSVQVAAKLRSDTHLREAYDTYRYALGIFGDHPPGTEHFFCIYVVY